MLGKNFYKSNRKLAFEAIYQKKYWDSETLSGTGSTLWSTQNIRKAIPRILDFYRVNSIVDVACGDFTWMPILLENTNKDIKYIGCDIVEEVINKNRTQYPKYQFLTLDFVEDKIPESDLIICREALQHLPVSDIKKALKNFSNSGAKYLLATTHIKRFGYRNYQDIKPGKCRDRNLSLPPFGLPNPVEMHSEEHGQKDKWLALWALPFDCS